MRPAIPTLLLAIAAASASARSEQTTVEVIQVPVYVTTSGAPVENLTRGNFKLFVNGKPQKIDYFDVVDFDHLSPEDARDPRQRPLPAGVRRHVFVVQLAPSCANGGGEDHRLRKRSRYVRRRGDDRRTV